MLKFKKLPFFRNLRVLLITVGTIIFFISSAVLKLLIFSILNALNTCIAVSTDIPISAGILFSDDIYVNNGISIYIVLVPRDFSGRTIIQGNAQGKPPNFLEA